MNTENNLPLFYVGQKVVYITGKCMPKDSIHVVKDVIKLECGCYCLDINSNNNYGNKPIVECKNCGKFAKYPRPGVELFVATSFRPLQEQKFPLIKYSKVLEEVNVCEN